MHLLSFLRDALPRTLLLLAALSLPTLSHAAEIDGAALSAAWAVPFAGLLLG